jgi:hypothetical protein
MDGETNRTLLRCSPILQGWTQQGWAAIVLTELLRLQLCVVLFNLYARLPAPFDIFIVPLKRG